VFRIVKRDTYAIWFKHLPGKLRKQFEGLEPNQTVNLIINGETTVWARMRRSSLGATEGLRLEKNRPMWESIPLGETFTLENTLSVAPNLREQLRVTAARVLRRHRTEAGKPMFDGYQFADFSGARDTASQRKAIRIASARGDQKPRGAERSLTRETLQTETLRTVEAATEEGVRLAFGRDHQFSIPAGLADEIGLAGKTWREALDSLVHGTYGGPLLAHVSEFASKFNDWSISRSRPPYFFSRTKAKSYGVPREDPRPGRFGAVDSTTYRLTELCKGPQKRYVPKPLNRIGDNGTVGGQTIVGLILLHELLVETCRRGLPVAVWPFDGLDIHSSAYEGRHVMFEPYPSSIRDPHVKQTDWNDAEASVLFIQEADCAGKLPAMLDLHELTDEQQARVLFEGWIIGQRP
jgi:hypothetical protein